MNIMEKLSGRPAWEITITILLAVLMLAITMTVPAIIIMLLWNWAVVGLFTGAITMNFWFAYGISWVWYFLKLLFKSKN